MRPEGLHLPAGHGANLTPRLQKPLPVLVIAAEGLPPVSVISQVINCSRILDLQVTRSFEQRQ